MYSSGGLFGAISWYVRLDCFPMACVLSSMSCMDKINDTKSHVNSANMRPETIEESN